MRDRTPDYYRILEVPQDASLRDIEAAYWKQARCPDGREALDLLNQAYEVLASEDRRRAYDEQRLLDESRARRRAHTPKEQRPAPRPRLWP